MSRSTQWPLEVGRRVKLVSVLKQVRLKRRWPQECIQAYLSGLTQDVRELGLQVRVCSRVERVVGLRLGTGQVGCVLGRRRKARGG